MWHLYQGMRHLCQGYLRVITQQYFFFPFSILSSFSSYHTLVKSGYVERLLPNWCFEILQGKLLKLVVKLGVASTVIV